MWHEGEGKMQCTPAHPVPSGRGKLMHISSRDIPSRSPGPRYLQKMALL